MYATGAEKLATASADFAARIDVETPAGEAHFSNINRYFLYKEKKYYASDFDL